MGTRYIYSLIEDSDQFAALTQSSVLFGVTLTDTKHSQASCGLTMDGATRRARRTTCTHINSGGMWGARGGPPPCPGQLRAHASRRPSPIPELGSWYTHERETERTGWRAITICAVVHCALDQEHGEACDSGRRVLMEPRARSDL